MSVFASRETNYYLRFPTLVYDYFVDAGQEVCTVWHGSN